MISTCMFISTFTLFRIYIKYKNTFILALTILNNLKNIPHKRLRDTPTFNRYLNRNYTCNQIMTLIFMWLNKLNLYLNQIYGLIKFHKE